MSLPSAFSIKHVLVLAWRGARQHLLFLLGSVALVAAAGYALQLIALIPRPAALHPVTVSVIVVAQLVGQLILSLGLFRITLSIVAGQSPRIEQLYQDYRLVGRYIVSSMVYGLAVTVGLVLLIIPGIIIMLRYQMYAYALVDKQLGPLAALKFSATITRGNLWRLVGLYLVLYLINIAGLLVFGVGLLITIPLTMVAQAAVYRQLVLHHDEDATQFSATSRASGVAR